MKKLGREQQQMTVFDSESDTRLYKYKLTLDKIKNELIKFGLSQTQAKVFIYLGKYGSKTAPEVARALQLPRTETYHIVNSLQNIGLVIAELVHPTKYAALDMRNAVSSLVKQEQHRVDTLAEKEEELAGLWEEVPYFVVETDESKSEKIQMLQGSGPIINKIKNMIGESIEEIKIFCTRQDASRFYHSDVFDLIEDSPTELKIIVSPSEKVPDFLSSISPQNVKIIPKNTENKCFVISDSKEVLIFLRNASHPSHQISASWSDSKSLIDMMTSLFDLSWENAEVAY